MKPITIRNEELSERSRRNLFILETIRRSGPISKADISRISGVNVVTISNYIEGYLRSNLVRVKSLDVSAGGRRPALLALNPHGGLAVGVGLNLLGMIGLVVDLHGLVIARVDKNRPGVDAKEIVDTAVKIITELFDKLSVSDREKVEGIGIGIAGIVDQSNGTIRWPGKAATGPCEYTVLEIGFKDTLEKKFRYPCTVENDATVACLGEQWMNPDPSIENLIYMFSGVGCGLMFNGEVYHGTTGGAGEISLNGLTQIKGAGTPWGAEVDFFHPWQDDFGIPEEVIQTLKNQKITSGPLIELTKGKREQVTLREIFQAAKAGDHVCIEKVKCAARRLGCKVALLVNLLNPQMVIIGGGLEEGGSILLDTVRSTVAELSFPEMANAVKIIPSRLGGDAVAIGAASLVVRQVFSKG